MKTDVINDLARPFDAHQIKRRRGPQGKDLDYLETHSVIARLNDVLAGDWSFEVLEHHRLGDEVVVLGRLTADGIVKTAFGSSRADGAPGDDLKAAASDSLKKAATLLGVGLHLYDRDRPQTEPPARRHADRGGRITSAQHAKLRELVDQVRDGDWATFRNETRELHGVEVAYLSRSAASDLIGRLIEETRGRRGRRGAA